MTDKELLEEIEKYMWFHSFKLNDNVHIKGIWGTPRADMIEDCMRSLDFHDKKVLDVGCRDGYFSFLAEKAGAKSVYAIDNCVSEGAVNFLIPYFKSKVKMKEVGLYDMARSKKRFDIIIFAGVLYHLRFPFWALQVLADLMPVGGKMVLESAIIADKSNKAILHCPSIEESPYQDGTSVTFFNIKGLTDTLQTLGIRTDSVSYVKEEHKRMDNDSVIRTCLTCTKVGIDKKIRDDYWRGLPHGVLNKSKKRVGEK